MKKYFSILLADVGLFLMLNQLVQARFTTSVFCGVLIAAYYCKCALYGQYCDQVGLDSSSANNYVQAQYQSYVNQVRRDCWSGCGCDCTHPLFHRERHPSFI
ncbi:hypothetical protein KKA33_03685 [Patescibacteria group bacterium]|nr:hypothetical protein [Patescibacteria group bacterium]